MLSMNLLTINGEKLTYDDSNKVDEEINFLRIQRLNAKSAIFSPINKINNFHDKNCNKGLRCKDSQSVF
jgi:hypothetical protein